MIRYAVALGSNLGDRAGTLRSALVDIGRLGEIAAVSGLYETMPIGGPEQDPFLNAVVVIDSEVGPEALLAGLGAVEDSHGRVRAERWGPRTLDLDIIASDGPLIDTPNLQVPHPRAHERRFVLEPLAEIWPDAPVGNGVTAEMALRSVLDQQVELLLRAWDDPERSAGIYWVIGQLVWFALVVVALFVDGSVPTLDLDWVRVFGVLTLAVGAYLVLASARSLGQALTALPEPALGAEMVEVGPYRLVRHPMYGGVVLLFVGVSLALRSWTAAVLSVGLLGFFWMKSSYEERQLRIAYPQYSSYRRRVKKRFLPFLV
jgi:2-amino-4-hydroxy-6-hydroxymethyldihydropteridine diphosphokinase